MNNMLMPQQAAPAPLAQPAPQAPDPAQLADARTHVAAMLKGLSGLAAKPPGSLSKRDVFNAAADMIAEGAFSTPQAKQQLVAEIAQMPDDESAIRQAIGGHILRLSATRQAIHQHFGPGE